MAVYGVLGTDWQRLRLRVSCTRGHRVDLTDAVGREEGRAELAARLELILAQHGARAGMVESEGGRDSQFEWVLAVREAAGEPCKITGGMDE